MKTKALLAVFMFFFSLAVTNGQKADAAKKSTVDVTCPAGLTELVNTWARTYNSAFPESEIIVQAPDQAAGDLVFYTKNDPVTTENNMRLPVARQIVVPVISRNFNGSGAIFQTGMERSSLTQILNSTDGRITTVLSTDEAVLGRVCDYAGIETINAERMNPQELIAYVGSSTSVIGFCTLHDLLAAGNGEIPQNIGILPFDRNGNGRLDKTENFTANATTFERAVWTGKYPGTLVNNIYAAYPTENASEAGRNFLQWILTNGQEYVADFGYSNLVLNEQQSSVNKLFPVALTAKLPAKAEKASSPVLPVLLALLVIGGIVVTAVVRRGQASEPGAIAKPLPLAGFDAGSAETPKGLYYDRSHTWAFMEQNGEVKVGMDDFLQHITGPITRTELKSAGDQVKKGELLATIVQKGKQLNLYSPVSGTILEQNAKLNVNASLLNSDPYAEGWVYKIEPTGWATEMKSLLMWDRYRNWLNDEFTRVKEFLSACCRAENPAYAHIVLQDGGALKDYALEEFGPEVWEDFQSKFLDNPNL